MDEKMLTLEKFEEDQFVDALFDIQRDNEEEE